MTVSFMSSHLTDRERNLRILLRDDFEAYSRACLHIRTKAGDVRAFKLNATQRALHQRLEAQRKTKGKVRALVLKGRQVGISTYIGGRFYWRVTHKKGFLTQILTHLDDASDNLFSMAKRYHDMCPELVKPQTGASNAKELKFSELGGGYKVATAGSKSVGRSATIQLFHGSEVAFWPNAEEHFAGIIQALSKANDTECVLESTANGIGNTFHSLWKAAEHGDSEFEAVFLPWFWHEEYTLTPPADWQPTEAWAEYEAVYGLRRDQTYWAFITNRDLSVVGGGEPSHINWKFRQEYPANADEAFQTSGNAFISAERVLLARKNKVQAYGPIILGVDPARAGGDKTGLVDRQGRRIGGHICERIDSDDLMATAGYVVRVVKQLRPIGLAKVVIDTTGLGAGLYDRLREQLGSLVMPVNFGARALESNKFVNRRAEIWDNMRTWLEDKAGVQIPDSDDLHADLCAPIWGPSATRFDSVGRLQLEAKDKIKERLTFSPDLGDASALTFGVDVSVIQDDDDEDPRQFGAGGRSSSTGY